MTSPASSPLATQNFAASLAASRRSLPGRGRLAGCGGEDRVPIPRGQRAGAPGVAHDALDQVRGESTDVEYDLIVVEGDRDPDRRDCPSGVIERVPQQACLTAADGPFTPRRSVLPAARRTLLSVPARAWSSNGTWMRAYRRAAGCRRRRASGAGWGSRCSCTGPQGEATRGAPAPPGLVLLDGLKQPGGLELVHQLAGPLSARADLAEHRLVGRGSSAHALRDTPRAHPRAGPRLHWPAARTRRPPS